MNTTQTNQFFLATQSRTIMDIVEVVYIIRMPLRKKKNAEICIRCTQCLTTGLCVNYIPYIGSCTLVDGDHDGER